MSCKDNRVHTSPPTLLYLGPGCLAPCLLDILYRVMEVGLRRDSTFSQRPSHVRVPLLMSCDSIVEIVTSLGKGHSCEYCLSNTVPALPLSILIRTLRPTYEDDRSAVWLKIRTRSNTLWKRSFDLYYLSLMIASCFTRLNVTDTTLLRCYNLW
ncbi:hypothetical protein J6590_010411 [Homalodisca vitripennis]|nr:hypothetical protein J6590_010411 [Homalodisca vitripennis]